MFNEVHSIHGHTLLLITKPSLQATALLQHLKQSLAITGKLHNIQRSLDDISSGSIILLDMMEADKKLMEGANKRGNSSRLTQSFHFFMFESIFSPVNALNQPI